MNRSLSNDDEVARLRRNAGAFGLDLDHHWANRAYAFNIQTALTNIGGDTAAIRRAQESSARYYQRAGRDRIGRWTVLDRVRSSRTTLNGYGFYARVAKETGNWLWETTQNWRSPGFEANDMGVLGRADYKWMLVNGVRQWTSARQLVSKSSGRAPVCSSRSTMRAIAPTSDWHGNFSATFKNYM